MKNKRIIRQPAETLMCTTSSEDKTFKFRRITWPDFPDGQAEWWQLQGDQVTMATAMKKLQQVQQVSPVRWPKVSGRKFVSTSFIDGRAVSRVRHPHAEAQFLANHPSQLRRWNTCDACIRRRWRKVVTWNFLQIMTSLVWRNSKVPRPGSDAPPLVEISNLNTSAALRNKANTRLTRVLTDAPIR